jgi:hypothetical protein
MRLGDGFEHVHDVSITQGIYTRQQI